MIWVPLLQTRAAAQFGALQTVPRVNSDVQANVAYEAVVEGNQSLFGIDSEWSGLAAALEEAFNLLGVHDEFCLLDH